MHRGDGRLGRRLGAQGRPHHGSHGAGHDRPRCVYVDFLKTGPAVSKTLRSVVNKTTGISRAGDLCVVDLAKSDGEVTGAVACI